MIIHMGRGLEGRGVARAVGRDGGVAMMAKLASRGSGVAPAARFVLLRKHSGKGGRPSGVGATIGAGRLREGQDPLHTTPPR